MTSEQTISVRADSGESFDAFLALPEGGSGPGLVMLHEIFGINDGMRKTARLLADEGYVVLVPDLFWRLQRNVELGYGEADIGVALSLYERLDRDAAITDIGAALAALRTLPACTGDAAVVGFCLGGTLALMAGTRLAPDAVVAFYPVAIPQIPAELVDVRVPTQIHLGGADPMCPPEAVEQIRARYAANANARIYVHAGAGHAFFNPDREEFNKLAAENSLTNALELLKPLMGPTFDLVALWEEHAGQEFFHRDADATIETMVEAPYVNHVPSMTGGTGREELRHFYRHFFVDVHPEDYAITLVSRTIGVNRVIDEMVASWTHDRMMDYVLPGIAPTGRKVVIAATGIVSFRGRKIRHEHLYYDHASLLMQLGLLDPAVFRVPGAEQAQKVLDPASVPSNGLMTTWRPPE